MITVKDYLTETNPDLYQEIMKKYPQLSVVYKFLVGFDKVLNAATTAFERIVQLALTTKEAD